MRDRFPLVALAVLSVTACTDQTGVGPEGGRATPPPAFGVVDAGSGGAVFGFWFLPPLVEEAVTEGDLDPNLLPAMEVCELDGNPSAIANPTGWEMVACVDLNPDPGIVERKLVASFPAGSAQLVPGTSYVFPWLPESPDLAFDKFYRIIVTLEGVDLGYVDVNPFSPNVPFDGDEDVFDLPLGQVLPVAVFINPQARCAVSEEYVLQCEATGVIDATGGVVSLQPDQEGWAKLSVVVPPGALPEGFPVVTITLERIDPVAFLQETGDHCIPGLPFLGSSAFDAPELGDCLRVSTEPEITVPLDVSALIEMCIDPFDYPDLLKLDEEQDTRLQIVRFEEGVTQGLPNVDASTCGAALPSPSQVGLLPVPKEGLLRYAAIGVNTLARALGPEPVAAHGEIRLAGSTSEFSRFRWALPGEMLKEAGDNAVIQQQQDGSESYDVTATVKVVDAGSPDLVPALAPSTVEGATVHFSTADGAVSAAEVTTGDDGLATVTWTVPGAPGTYTLDARALGLLASPVPDHSGLIDFTEATVTFTATVVGQPAAATQSPDPGTAFVGLPGETLSTPLQITVVDAAGNPVVGWDVTWTTTCEATDPADCDGSVSGGAQTDAAGQASGLWTLATTGGTQTATATVGGVTFSFEAGTWTAEVEAPNVCQVVVDGVVSEDEWACAEADGHVRSFTAKLGKSTLAEVRWQNDGENLYLLVRVMQSRRDKVNDVRFDFDNDGSGVHDEGDDAIGFDADNGTFYDEYLTKKCAESEGESQCGERDHVSQDGQGAVGYDGARVVYELSHPLQGTLGEDFVRAAGDPLGFFLTLSRGEGAKGGTHFPGFREFEIITIR